MPPFGHQLNLLVVFLRYLEKHQELVVHFAFPNLFKSLKYMNILVVDFSQMLIIRALLEPSL